VGRDLPDADGPGFVSPNGGFEEANRSLIGHELLFQVLKCLPVSCRWRPTIHATTASHLTLLGLIGSQRLGFCAKDACMTTAAADYCDSSRTGQVYLYFGPLTLVLYWCCPTAICWILQRPTC
jgi:hypothetical protein